MTLRKPHRPIPPEISAEQRWAIHGLLLVASLVIYAIFRALWTATAHNANPTMGSVLRPFVVLLLLSGLAFGTVAWLQPHWRSRDAARVASTVWLAASVFYLVVVGCPTVLLLIVIPFVPFCLGALIGHNIGRFHHPAHWDGIEMNLDD